MLPICKALPLSMTQWSGRNASICSAQDPASGPVSDELGVVAWEIQAEENRARTHGACCSPQNQFKNRSVFLPPEQNKCGTGCGEITLAEGKEEEPEDAPFLIITMRCSYLGASAVHSQTLSDNSLNSS